LTSRKCVHVSLMVLSSCRLWRRLLVEMRKEELSLEEALNYACAYLDLPASEVDVNFLPIYRWGGQLRAAKDDGQHEMLPFFAARFAAAFLARAPADAS